VTYNYTMLASLIEFMAIPKNNHGFIL
jgi:hypothetical protein